MKAFVIYPTYTAIDGQNYVQLFGRMENGESFVTTIKFNPYFYIKLMDLKKAKNIANGFDFKSEMSEMKTFSGEKTEKIIFKNNPELNKVKQEFHECQIDTYEADVKPATRFMIDKDLFGLINIEGDYEPSERVDRVYRNPAIASVNYLDFKPKLKILSLDIESDKNIEKLFCIGLYSENYKKCFMVSGEKSEKFISCSSEEECLEKFKQELIKFDPDIITGWNVINFDFNYLKKLFQKHKISFDIGRTNENAAIRIESDFFRNSSMDVPGRLVLDGLNFIKDPHIQEAPTIKNKEFESYTLENVSQEILGKGKTIKEKSGQRHKEIERLFLEDKEKLAEYNLQDTRLVYEIIEKTDVIELAIERSQLIGLPLDKVIGSIAAFDSLYIREANKRGLVSPTTRFQNKEQKIKGGFVMEPKSGIYHNVLVFDFKSLYPSIIKTFNIDPASFLEKPEKNSIESPNKAYFKNQDGILPLIIQRLHEAREKAKKEKRELSSYAIKIIMNSFFGVLASPNCRYFDLRMANAITNFGQEIIKLTVKKIEELGYEVIYGDTDSVFVNAGLNKSESEKLAKKIPEVIDSFYENYVKEKFNRKSYLDLEFDKLYTAMVIPQIRMKLAKNKEENVNNLSGLSRGAKKRYAGLLEENGKEELDIVGLEAVRGDWTEAAKEFQRELLLKIFHKENPSEFIKEFIKNLKSGKYDYNLIYRKSIRKDLKEYTKTTPPHVKAARQLDEVESNIIEYYITTEGPEPLQKLKHRIDYEHYIKKQIEPIARQILELLGLDFEEVVHLNKQKTLF